jgi:hypothetical protein
MPARSRDQEPQEAFPGLGGGADPQYDPEHLPGQIQDDLPG